MQKDDILFSEIINDIKIYLLNSPPPAQRHSCKKLEKLEQAHPKAWKNGTKNVYKKGIQTRKKCNTVQKASATSIAQY